MIVLITGAMAAGKSTVAQGVAERLPCSVHLRGDVFRRMIVNGRIEMSDAGDPGALNQLRLRYSLAAEAALRYADAGFDVVYQDTVIGAVLAEVAALYVTHPLHIVVLCPRAEVVAQREDARGKVGYTGFSVASLQSVMDATPKLGYWLDNSDQSVAETVEAVIASLRR